MKSLVVTALLTLGTALPVVAGDLITVETGKSVTEAMDSLEAAVTGAGATVFARVDHAMGASKVDMELANAQLLIFGNPKLGTPAMQADLRAGLFLPLKVLAYEDEQGQVRFLYEDPADMLGGLEIPADAEVIAKMKGALGKLTAAAAN